MPSPSSSLASGPTPASARPVRNPVALPSRKWSCSEVEQGQNKLLAVKLERMDTATDVQARLEAG